MSPHGRRPDCSSLTGRVAPFLINGHCGMGGSFPLGLHRCIEQQRQAIQLLFVPGSPLCTSHEHPFLRLSYSASLRRRALLPMSFPPSLPSIFLHARGNYVPSFSLSRATRTVMSTIFLTYLAWPLPVSEVSYFASLLWWLC